MSLPTTKRKVMGRVELGHERSGSSSPRVGSGNSGGFGATSSGRPVAGSSRARVDMSSLAGPSSVAGGYGSGAPRTQSATHPAAVSMHATPLSFVPPHMAFGLASPPLMQASSPGRASHVYSSSSVSARPTSPTDQHTKAARVRLAPQSHAHATGRQGYASPPSGRSTPASGLRRMQGDPQSSRPHSRARSSAADSSTPGGRRPRVSSSEILRASSPSVRSRTPSPTLRKPPQQPPHLPISAQQRRISYASNTSMSGSSTLSVSSAGKSPEAFAGSTQVQMQRPALTANTSFKTHMQSFSEPLGSPVKRIDTSGSQANMSGMFEAYRDSSPLASSSSTNSGFPLLSPATERDPEALEAKTNRKILDLEITNKSLLAINSSLEVVKLKQAREIRELKRRIRDGGSLGHRIGVEGAEISDTGVDEDDSVSDDSGELGALDADGPVQAELEAAHARCKSMIDDMVQRARDAILSRHDTSSRPFGNRVLHPAELEGMMEGSNAAAGAIAAAATAAAREDTHEGGGGEVGLEEHDAANYRGSIYGASSSDEHASPPSAEPLQTPTDVPDDAVEAKLSQDMANISIAGSARDE